MKVGDVVRVRDSTTMWSGVMVIDAKTSYPISYYRVNAGDVYIVSGIRPSTMYFSDPEQKMPVSIADLIGPCGREYECDVRFLQEV